MSTLKIDTLNTRDDSSSIPVERLIKGACAAWVNFNGTGTVAIRASYNVSSITDNAVGDWTVNFATPMPDIGYAAQSTMRVSLTAGAGVSSWGTVSLTHSTSSYRVHAFAYVGSTNTLTLVDPDTMSITINR